jgi:MoaA/NifB/PqqE/SkfB family radical SAM enzyme
MLKKVRTENYNYNFDNVTGEFARWGKNFADNAEYSPIGPEIADIEITTICTNGCKHCYKGNTANGKYMSFETFKKLLDKLPENVGQIAFGADHNLMNNPDIWKIMEYTRTKGIVPNITCADIDNIVADNLAKYCGAVAISRYADKNICYNSVKKLTDRGMKQVNIHQLASLETQEQIIETMNDTIDDERLKGLNAIVLLSLKKKGRGTSYNRLPDKEFEHIINFAITHKISVGMDSCSCNKFLDMFKDHEGYKVFEMSADPCESGLFSSYFDVEGKFFPCSFSCDNEGWKEGIDVIGCNDFITDVWNNERVIEFRKKLIANKRSCPFYEI